MTPRRPVNHDEMAAKLRTAFALHDFGIAIMRQNLRRRMPGATEAEVGAALKAWLHSKPIPGAGARDMRVTEGTGRFGDGGQA